VIGVAFGLWGGWGVTSERVCCVKAREEFTPTSMTVGLR
jgi:hypothetical protein